jgi:DNA replication protein DnaC
MLNIQISKSVMLKSGILEAYWDKEITDFYGHPEKKSNLEPIIQIWNTRYPDAPLNLNFDKGREIYEKFTLYGDNLDNARKNGISLFLWGSNGTGKTLLGVCALKEAIRQGYRAQMTSLGGILECYTDGWYNPERREQFNDRIKNVDFLLIDDVGKEYRSKHSDFAEVAFDNLIRYRTFRQKPFILTTNTDIERIRNTYGKSLTSLIIGKCYGIEVSGVDYRIAIQAKDVIRQLRGN